METWPDPGIDDDRWVRVAEAARLAQVDPRTIRRWTDAGDVRARIGPGGVRQVSLSSLRASFERATAARRRPEGLTPDAERARPEVAIPYLAAAAPTWAAWNPRRLPLAKVEALHGHVEMLEEALADVKDALHTELLDRARDAED